MGLDLSLCLLLILWRAVVIFENVITEERQPTDIALIRNLVLVVSEDMILQHPSVDEGSVALVTELTLLVSMGLSVFDEPTFKFKSTVAFMTLVVIVSGLGWTSSNSLTTSCRILRISVP